MSEDLSADQMRERLSYDPRSGRFEWIDGGREAGWVRKDGYSSIRVDGKEYGSHRLAFLYMTGRWPVEEVDHIDRNPSNNCWSNLREATHAQNMRNRGRPGVGKCNSRWRAYIKLDGVQRHIGMFDTRDDAVAAYMTEAKMAFGEYAPA